jgi:hypothetical protein
MDSKRVQHKEDDLLFQPTDLLTNFSCLPRDLERQSICR